MKYGRVRINRLYVPMAGTQYRFPPLKAGMQCLLFYALFMISQMFQSVILLVPLLLIIFTNAALWTANFIRWNFL